MQSIRLDIFAHTSLEEKKYGLSLSNTNKKNPSNESSEIKMQITIDTWANGLCVMNVCECEANEINENICHLNTQQLNDDDARKRVGVFGACTAGGSVLWLFTLYVSTLERGHCVKNWIEFQWSCTSFRSLSLYVLCMPILLLINSKFIRNKCTITSEKKISA